MSPGPGSYRTILRGWLRGEQAPDLPFVPVFSPRRPLWAAPSEGWPGTLPAPAGPCLSLVQFQRWLCQKHRVWSHQGLSREGQRVAKGGQHPNKWGERAGLPSVHLGYIVTLVPRDFSQLPLSLSSRGCRVSSSCLCCSLYASLRYLCWRSQIRLRWKCFMAVSKPDLQFRGPYYESWTWFLERLNWSLHGNLEKRNLLMASFLISPLKYVKETWINLINTDI